MVNRLIEGKPEDVVSQLIGPILFYLALYFLSTTGHRFYGYFVEIKMIPQLRKHIAEKAFSRLLEKNYYFYQNSLSGGLSNRINDLITGIPDITQIFIDSFFMHSLTLLIALLTLAYVNIYFAMFMFIWLFVFIAGATVYSKKLHELSDLWATHGSTITGKLVDSFSNILSIKLFASKEIEKSSLTPSINKAVQAEQKLQWAYLWMWFCYGYSFFLLLIFNFYLLCKGRKEGWITIGDFVLVLGINITIMDFLWRTVKDFSQFSKIYGKITQSLKVILAPQESKDHPLAQPLILEKGQIVVESLKFHYKGNSPLFTNLSVNIEPGQKIGLVGYSGGGKTTFVNLILRLYSISEGTILIDNQDIQKVTQESLNNVISMIPQDPSLFHRTLMENIRYGRLNATDNDVIEAAKKANAHDFITRLPEGYHSLVGERGVKLSGGQRQRIAIARAFLRNAPILILDEATSQLDSVTENLIQESLLELMEGKTTLVIAHRLSTILNMDRILVFDKGTIVQDGPHKQLVKKEGVYKTLWKAQIGGFLGDSQSTT